MLPLLLATAFATESATGPAQGPAQGPAPAPVPEAGLAVVPFGVAQFAWKHPVRGTLYALTQAGGLGVGVWAGVERAAAIEANDETAMNQWQTTMTIGVASAAVAYAVSLVDGSRLAEERALAAQAATARRNAVVRFDASLALSRGNR